LPAIVLQSAIMGGGYATGREVSQYAGRFGEQGWLAVGIILIGFTLFSVLAFELARVAQAYDYKRWIRELIGPLWPLFDLVVVTMSLLVIAVMSAAMGSILRRTLGIPYWLGLAIAFIVVAFLAWRGSQVMERFKVIGSVLLYIGYLCFAWLVLTAPIETLEAASAQAGSVGAAGLSPFTTIAVALSGVLYVGYNLSVYPVGLFCLHRQTRRSETVLAGIASGLLMTIPFVLTFLCLIKFYPSPAVLDAEIPWLEMIDRAAGGPAWIATFGFIAGWTLLETAIASIHALVDRVDKNLGDLPAFLRPTKPLQPIHKVGLSIGILAISMALAQFGIIALVAKGYSALAWGFIVLLALPLLTVGVVKVVRAGSRGESFP
jgi:uncharacterized membrane protein YkvI